jgi:uncharacterized RDD family membrane protein YckC
MQPMQAMPPGTDPTAVTGKRIGAFLIDLVVMAIVGFVLVLTFVEFIEYQEPFVPRHVRNICPDTGFQMINNELCIASEDSVLYADSIGPVQPLNFLISLMVFVVWQGLSGLTPGKALVGIRTVNAQGTPPGILRAFLRWVLLIVDLFPWCIPGLTGLIVANSSKGHRRVGDMVASTYVIDKAYLGQPVGQAQPSTGWGTPVAGAPMPGMAGMPPSPTIPGPPPTAAPPPAAAAPAAPVADPTQPQWDAARNAYIAWDATAQVWKQFDDASQEWRPI